MNEQAGKGGPCQSEAANPARDGVRRRRRGRPRNEDKRNLADALMDAAEQLLEQEGIGALTERRIAGLVDVSETVIAYYFGDKNGLLFAMAERTFAFIETTLNSLMEIDPASPTASLQIARTMIEAHHARPWLARLMTLEQQRGDESSIWQKYLGRRGPRSLVQIRKALLHHAAARHGTVTADAGHATRIALSLMCVTSGTLSLYTLSEQLGIGLAAMREEPWLMHVAGLVDFHLHSLSQAADGA